ncbi:hypothetical protein DSL92_08225 [Billgrantia gudaonensis]|uniref:Uncharacterized protein n=1 Tax=Billgrantia gudaonensis TaxID=376427 RepID=A0A432JGF3_9GAMM|nr:hypothetical protein DSL92_08225 [Halomonas gudaonensis]
MQSFPAARSLFLFASVLARFLSLYASINSFHELHVTNLRSAGIRMDLAASSSP